MTTNAPSSLPGLYIHIPFCRSKCPYCSFYSETDTSPIDPFLASLRQEMTFYREAFPLFDTLYIGGGTPSLLNIHQLETLLCHIRECFPLTKEAEITLEMNPADGDRDFFADLPCLGINRLNLGIQSFQDEILSFLGRRHSAPQARRAIEYAHRAGFRRLGLDLIYAVPGQNMKMWFADLQQAAATPADHLSCYQLTVDTATPFGISLAAKEFSLPAEDEQADFFRETSSFLTKQGYQHYEISNFAQNDAAISRHNSKYWDHTPYLGLGPGAHSFDGTTRWSNPSSLQTYQKQIRSHICPAINHEELTATQLRLEKLFLGFRTQRGIDIKAFNGALCADILAEKRETLSRLEKEGLIVIEDGFIRPTLSGMALADQLALI